MKTIGAMKYIRIAVLALMTVALSSNSFAQNARNQRNANQNSGYTVSGRIIDAADGTPLELVNIIFENNSFWAVSDLEGKFSLKLRNGEYHYEVSYIGYETVKGVLKVDGKDISNFNIKMEPSSLALQEVTVTAKQQAMGSSSVIDQTALQHLQPKSIEDMLQLTPGSLTQNPSINSVGQAYIREIDGSNNNAMGTSIVLDGAPISNDAVFMSMSTSKNGTSDISGQSTTGKGVDLRTISPDNVESIEVIRGIPSVEYGNLTSGAVIVKTKKGMTPWEVKGKTDPNSKMAYIGKGFALSTGTTINISADYSSSYSDIRKKAKGYERINGSLGLSQTFFNNRPLSVNFKASYFQNLNTVRTDPQQQSSERSESDNKGVRLILNGDWNIKTALISNLSYNLSLNYSHQRDTDHKFIILRSGLQPIGSSTEEGEHEAPYLHGNYFSDYYVDGKPLSVFAQLKANKTIMKGDDFTSQFKAGVEWSYDVNKGEGLVFDPTQPPIITDVQTVRPRAYSDIPAMNTVSGFLENKTIMPIGTTSLTAQVGVRLSELFIDRNYLDRGPIFTADPRVNVEWNILNRKNNSFIDNFSLNGGWGVTSKMPSLAYLYPDKAYYDQVSYNMMDPHFAVLSTKIVENTGNVNIKPSTGNKIEAGFSFEKGKINGMVTFFYETYKDEFNYRSVPLTQAINKYSYDLPAGTYRINSFDPESKNITYVTNSGSGTLAPSAITPDSLYVTYSSPMNSAQTIKKGIEYSVNFGQIQTLRTSLVIDGAWYWIRHRNDMDYWSILNNVNGQNYPYIVLYPGGGGSISERINTNFRFITHIPAVKMIFSTTAQVVWRETSQSFLVDSDGNDIWYKSQSIDGSDCIAIDPVGYMDYSGRYYEWDTKYRNKIYKNAEYEMISTKSVLSYYDREVTPGHIIFNFRLTKEFGKNFEVSFIANNLFNTRKIYEKSTTGAYQSLAIDQYFGAELKLKL